MEHAVNMRSMGKGSFVMRVMRGVYQELGWSFFVRDCCLDRDVEAGGVGMLGEIEERVEMESAFG